MNNIASSVFCTWNNPTAPHRTCTRCGFSTHIDPAHKGIRQCPAPEGLDARHRGQLEINLRAGDKVRAVTEATGLHAATEWLTEKLNIESCGCDNRQAWLNRKTYWRIPLPWTTRPTRVMFEVPHGMGDVIQFTVVLRHLRAVYPHLKIDVCVKTGVGNIFCGLADRWHWVNRKPPRANYDGWYWMPWYESFTCYADSPATKAEKCLREMFGIQPRPELCRYHVCRPDWAKKRAKNFSESLGRPFALLHYQGNSARKNKNLDEHVARKIVDAIRARGFVPVILDWDHRSGLLDISGVVNPDEKHWLWGGHGTGEACVIAALAERSAYNIGIDSGPGHIFGAVDTPGTIVWGRHSPVNYFCLAPNITHVVRKDYRRHIRGDVDVGDRYFRTNYNSVVADRNYRLVLPEWIDAELSRVAR